MTTPYGYCKAKRTRESGVALITALLLLMLMSALAVGLVYRVMTEVTAQKSDTGNTVSFYGAEAGMEKMTADLGAIFGNKASPTWCDIQAVQSTPPDLSSMGLSFSQYTVTANPAPVGCAMPASHAQLVTQGSNAGLQALIVPLSLNVTSQLTDPTTHLEIGEVRMQRSVEIAEIPVFQFGVFSQSDLAFFAGANFDFNGRVQTNGNLYLAASSGTTLTMHYPIRSAGLVIRDTTSNQQSTSSQSRTGTILVPTQTAGCDTSDGSQRTTATSTCRALAMTEESTASGWSTLSNSTYHKMILSGVPTLSLPFVKTGVNAIEIIHRKEAADTADMQQSRLYNLAQIRVLISDDPNDLPYTAGYTPTTDPQNIRLANVKTFAATGSPDYSSGVPVVGTPGKTMFAEGVVSTVPAGLVPGAEPNWKAAPAASIYNLLATYQVNPVSLGFPAPAITPTTWNLIDGYIRVEIRTDPSGSLPYQAVTQEWLELGFARGFAPGASAAINPKAILLLQEEANRNGGAEVASVQSPTAPHYWSAGLVPGTSGAFYYGTATRNNWYPINMYDSREGVDQDLSASASGCYTGGIMNLVEIDVKNLSRWLYDTTPGTNGSKVENTSQNGYLLYFSDRRGMRPGQYAGPVTSPDPNYGRKTQYGFENVVSTYLNSSGIPAAGEDVNKNGYLDVWGAVNLGLGFGVPAAKIGNPYYSNSCTTVAPQNWVSGARHAVRLVNGSRGNVPMLPDGSGGGFTLASENPAYVLGNYNADSTFNLADTHSHSAIIADTVTFLSNNWTDQNMWNNPTTVNSRPATETFYRVAVASGKGLDFAQPPGTPDNDFGTDGGVHNFLRYLENWGGVKSHYDGSMVSLYYSQYATGTYKSTGVYSAPQRFYSFDTDFQTLSNMPPGTPRLHDVVNLGFTQVFTDPTTDQN